MERCRRSFLYFALTYCHIEAKDDGAGDWVRFDLWPDQKVAAEAMQANKLLIILKARQLGQTWLCVAFALWLMLFHPIATILMFSLRDEEAKKLLKRLKGMHKRLPEWMQQNMQRRKGQIDSQSEVEFENGSSAQAMCAKGDSYTASLVIVDEADLIPNFGDLMASLKPTIADGGRMLLVSKANKSKPNSPFKSIYRAAHTSQQGDGGSEWKPLFLSWRARKDRTEEWYEQEKASYLQTYGSLDDFHGNYPATPEEALSPRTLDKRIPAEWLRQCYAETPLVDLAKIHVVYNLKPPPVPGLKVWRLPTNNKGKFVCGADPAMGNPTSDDSSATWIDQDTGEQVAELSGKLEMTIFGEHVGQVSRFFNRSPVMVEENNHGHTVIKHLRENFPDLRLLSGHMGRTGWVSSQLGKVLLYDAAADAFKNGEAVIHSFDGFCQLASIDGNTLRAPEGDFDDRADAFALALAGRNKAAATSMEGFKAVRASAGVGAFR
jgi:hypothetical protein